MSLPIGTQVPRRGNAFSRTLGYLILRLMGWRLAGAIPNVPKMVLLGAPHTSNMDGVIGLSTLFALGIRASTMIKDSAFKGVVGSMLRWMGAIPINRRSAKGVVEQSIDAFNNNPKMFLLIAPEGTRSNAEEWKRGFYHIAHGAQAPILPAACDYKKKIITFGPAVMPSGDYAKDLQTILEFYRDYGVACHEELMSKPICDIKGIQWTPPSQKDA
ncbi:MAG: lysophospholipid acyltransferase family protein [Pseudomonadota bacterium]